MTKARATNTRPTAIAQTQPIFADAAQQPNHAAALRYVQAARQRAKDGLDAIQNKQCRLWPLLAARDNLTRAEEKGASGMELIARREIYALEAALMARCSKRRPTPQRR